MSKTFRYNPETFRKELNERAYVKQVRPKHPDDVDERREANREKYYNQKGLDERDYS